MVQTKFHPQEYPHMGRCLCQCLRKIDPQRLFRENSHDVTNALVDVMISCGIHDCKARGARDVIFKAFRHYDDVRHCSEKSPMPSLRKEHIIHELGCNCMMTRIEAQFTYSLIKQAFKAFYNGTSDFSIRNPIIEAELIHGQKNLWIHAAKRTAQIYAEYEGMFLPFQKNMKERILKAYDELYERMKNRANPVILESCCCENCIKRIVPSSQTKTRPESKNVKQEKLKVDVDNSKSLRGKKKLKKQEIKKLKEIEEKQNLEKLPRCPRCKSLKLLCTCYVDEKTGFLNYPCSQGPYKVRWRLMTKEPKPDPCITNPRNHVCPIDCDELSEMTRESMEGGNTICGTENDICENETESTETEECDEETEICAEEIEEEKSTEVSDTRTVYSCHMPQPDYTPIMLKDKKKCSRYIQTKKPCIKKIKSTLTICVCKCEPASKISSKSTDSCRLMSGESCNKSSSDKKQSSDYPIESKTTTAELVMEAETFESTEKPSKSSDQPPYVESNSSQEVINVVIEKEPSVIIEKEPSVESQPKPKPEPKPEPKPSLKPVLKPVLKPALKPEPKAEKPEPKLKRSTVKEIDTDIEKPPEHAVLRKEKKLTPPRPPKILRKICPCKQCKHKKRAKACIEEDEKLYAFLEPSGFI